jgi:pyruvate/2-oxoglutarate dehydrogenase complex dihydrolipoamide dehydrogenase (E3) component
MPSKTLIYTAELLHHARHGRDFGLDIPSAGVDMAQVHARKTEIIGDFAQYRAGQLESDAFTLLREHARFTGPDRVRLEQSGEEITADFFVIATGSVPYFPDVPGLDDPHVWTSDDVLDLQFLPESVVVLGGGVVACELAQYLRRMGSRVTQVQRSARILKEASREAAEVIEQVFDDEGITLYTGTRLQRVERTGAGFRVHFEHIAHPVQIDAAHVLCTLGRVPNTRPLDLAAAGIALLPSGHVKVDAMQRTTNARVYAAGDVCGPVEIVHLAIMQGDVAAQHATGQDAEPVNYDIMSQVYFTDPQVAAVGLSEAQLQERGIPFEQAKYPFSDHGKSILMNAHYGYVRVFARKSDGKILGAECVGKDAGELIHPMAVALALGAHCRPLLKAHWYHPTLSEIWTYPLEDLAEFCK